MSLSLDTAGVREDEQVLGYALGPLQQLQGVDFVAILGSEERQTDGHGERRLEVEREGRGNRRVEDVACGWLKIGTVECSVLGIEAATIWHQRDPLGATWLDPSGS